MASSGFHTHDHVKCVAEALGALVLLPDRRVEIHRAPQAGI